jgi:hypothetical protein
MVPLSAHWRGAVDEYMLWADAPAARGRAYWIGGRYLSRAVEGAGGWQFARLELRADLISHYPSGWSAKPAALDDA